MKHPNVSGTEAHLLPPPEAESRLVRLQTWMRESAVDLVCIMQNADLAYFAGTVQLGVFCAPQEGMPLYLVQKSLSRAQLESPWKRLMGISSLKKVPAILATEGMQPVRRIGLEMDVLPANNYFRMQSLFPEAELVDASSAIRRVRMIKSPYEVAQMREAAAAVREAFSNIPDWMRRPGATELEISARLEGRLRELGHQGLTRMRGFNNEMTYGTVASGPSAAAPTCFPGPDGFEGLYPSIPNGSGPRVLNPGDPVMIDIAGGYNGYIIDVTRIFAMGELSDDMVNAYSFSVGLLREIEAHLRPGMVCSQIWEYASTRVQSSPFAEFFMGAGDSKVRFVGHGVGLELDELPVLAAGFDFPLASGMTIAIEPKLIFPGRGGVGIENTYLITDAGFENLTPLPEELYVV